MFLVKKERVGSLQAHFFYSFYRVYTFNRSTITYEHFNKDIFVFYIINICNSYSRLLFLQDLIIYNYTFFSLISILDVPLQMDNYKKNSVFLIALIGVMLFYR